jgi:hypothetical protein
MTRFLRLLGCLVALGCLGAGAAQAQGMGRRPQPNRGLGMPAALPEPTTSAGNIGTRLEPGAVLCRTSEELQRRQAAMVAQGAAQAADDAATLPAGCYLVGTRTPVEIVERRGYGRTQVKTLGRSSETGWTDAYLPQR